MKTWAADDLEAAEALLNRSSPRDQFPRQQLLEAVFDDPDHDPDLLLWEPGAAIAAGVVRSGRDPIVGYVKILAVAPERRRQGVGTHLLAELERRLSERGARVLRVFSDAPSFLRPGVDYRLTEFVSFIERRGYVVRRPVCNMSVDLRTARLETSADEARLAGEGIDIRRLHPADADAFAAYMDKQWQTNWRIEACRSLSRDPVPTHIAVMGGAIVGFASHSVSGPGQFGPMGTNPELRGRGVGAVLLRRCMADQRAAGLTESDIQWVGPKGFYADHVGAVISRCFWQYEKEIEV